MLTVLLVLVCAPAVVHAAYQWAFIDDRYERCSRCEQPFAARDERVVVDELTFDGWVQGAVHVDRAACERTMARDD
jgi:hypothetical protein